MQQGSLFHAGGRGAAHRGILPAALAILMAAASAGAEPAKIALRGKVGLGGDFNSGGFYRVRSWAPAVIEAANGGEAFDGHVEVRFEGPDGASMTAAAPLTLATGTRKRLTLLVRPYTEDGRFGLRLRAASGRVLAEAEARGRAVEARKVVGVVTSRLRPGLPISDPDARRIAVVYLENEDLPAAPEAYDALDALAVVEPEARADNPAEAAAAARAWVAGGRTLVIAAGDAGPQLAGGPFAWAAAPIAGSVNVRDFEGLRRAFARDAFTVPERAAACADLSAQGGRVVARAPGGAPLAVERRAGLGLVRLIGPDLQATPFLGWTGLPRLWDGLLDLPPAPREGDSAPVFAPAYAGRDALQGAFETLRFLVPVSIGFIIFFLSLYVLAVGPGDWLLLRRLGRRFGLTWLTVPLWSLIFCAALYAVTAYKRGGNVTVRRASVVDILPEKGGVRGVTYAAVYSPSADVYDFSVSAPSGAVAPRGVGEGVGALGGGGAALVPEGGTVALKGFPIAANVMRTVDAEWRMPGPGYAADLAKVAGGWKVTWHGPRPLENPLLVLPDGTSFRLPTLQPGQAAAADSPQGIEIRLRAEYSYPGLDWGEPGYFGDDGEPGQVDGEAGERLRSSLIWYSFARFRTDGALSPMEPLDPVFGAKLEEGLLEARTLRRIDAAPAIHAGRAVLAGWDDRAPARVTVNGNDPAGLEVTLVRVWFDVNE